MSRYLPTLLTVAAILAALSFSLKSCRADRSDEARRPDRPSPAPHAATLSVAAPGELGKSAESPAEELPDGRTGLGEDPHLRAVTDNLERLLGELRTSGDPETAAAIAGLLRDSLAEASVAAILAYLESGRDAGIEAGFVVGAHAFLESAPTVRVLLLDLLGEIDVRAAAEYSKSIFAGSRSADEWAIALRNYTAGHDLRSPERALADGYLTDRVAEALGRSEWVAGPSVGFLHTLDFAVLAPDPTSVGALAGFLSAENEAVHPAVRRVATGQLWRMAHRDFTGTLGLLEASNAIGSLAADERAVLLAHADVREGAERAAVEAYLADDLAPGELERFAEVFPYFGLEVTNHLATQNGAVDMNDDADAVLETYAAVREWRRDGGFAGKDEALGRIEARLERLAVSIARGLENPTR